MKQVYKRTLGMLLALLLCLSLLPTFAIAETEEPASTRSAPVAGSTPYYIDGQIVDWEPTAFAWNSETLRWECPIRFGDDTFIDEATNTFAYEEFEVRVLNNDGDNDWYGADASQVLSVGERFYVYDGVENVPLIHEEDYNGEGNAKRTFLVSSHPGTYTFVLDPINMKLSVEYAYDDPTAEPHTYILGFQDQDEIPWPMDDLTEIDPAYGSCYFGSEPAAGEIPGKGENGPFDVNDTILWASKETMGGDDEWIQWFYIASDGVSYGKSSPVIRNIPAEGFELQLEPGKQTCRFVCTLAPTVAGVYDFYYGTESHKLVAKRREVSVEYGADVITITRSRPHIVQPAISNGGTIFSGDEVTVTAAYAPGYRFVGWYDGGYSQDEQTGEIYGDCKTTAFDYTFYPTYDTELHALYEPIGDEDGNLPIDETNFPDEVFRAYVANTFDVNGDDFLDGDEIAAVRVINIYFGNDAPDGEPQSPASVHAPTGLRNPASSWSVIGNILNSNWGTDYEMTQIGTGVWQSEPLAMNEGEQFKVRYGGTWEGDNNYGTAGDWDGSATVKCAQNGGNLTVRTAGTYVVTLYLDKENTAYLTMVNTAGMVVPPVKENTNKPEAHAWNVIGDICGSDWDTDFPMTEGSANVWKSAPLTLQAGEQLKVRAAGGWDVNYGIAEGWDGGATVPAGRDGENLVIPADDTYVVTLTFDGSVTLTLTNSSDELVAPYRPSIDAYVASLQGIEFFPNLEELYCDPFTFGVDGALTSVDLTYNTKLWMVDLACNPLTSIDVSMLPELRELMVGYTNLSGINISENHKLKNLWINDTNISYLSLYGNPLLEKLDVCGSNITSLDFSGCTSLMADYRAGERTDFDYEARPYLQGLHLYGGVGDEYNIAINANMTIETVSLANIDVTSNIDVAEQIVLSPDDFVFPGEDFTLTAPAVHGYRFVGWYAWYSGSLDPDAEPISTEYTVARGSGGADWHYLAKYEEATGVEIDETSFPDAVFRAYVASEFDTDGNGFLDDAEIAAATTIEINDTALASLEGIAFFPELETLCCDPFTFGVDGSLTGVDLSHNTKLRVVDLECNPLTALDVSMLPELEELSVGFMNLSSIDVTHNPKLKKLLANDSGITSLDLSGNSLLEILDICGSGITVLDLGGCPSLMADYNAGERTDFDYEARPYLQGLHLYGGEGDAYNLALSPTTTVICRFAQVKTASLSLDGNIRVNFYVVIPDEVLADQGSYARITFNGATTVQLVKDAPVPEKDGVKRRRFTQDIVAKEMNDPVTLELFDGSGRRLALYKSDGTSVNGAYTYAATDYAEAAEQSDLGQTLKDLVQACVDYGVAAQLQFGYEDEGLTIPDAVTAVTANDVRNYEAVYTGALPDGIERNTSSLLIESDNSIRQYFYLEDGHTIDEFTFTVDGTVTQPKRAAKGKYYLEVTNIPAKDLDVTHTFAIIDGDENVLYSVAYSALSYAYKALTYSDELAPQTLKNMAKAIYLYNQAANAYFEN